MHFAAFALVGESVAAPELYYHNNVVGTLSVLEAMVAAKVSPSLVFSSSCAVFGSPKNLPISENDPKSPESPYGHTKHMCEQMISDFCHAHGLKAIALRYFNACGASDDGSIGEAHDPETHLIPILIKAAIDGKAMKIFGGDFETKDGTCVRDYIHIDDLALSHLKAAQVMEDKDPSYYEAIHLGTGQGYSNLEILEKVEEILGKKIEHEVTDRRAGDSAALYANNQRAKEVLDFKTEFSDLHTIISSAIAWHQASPNGYAK
jgi:UDP-glucose 4-epimerase